MPATLFRAALTGALLTAIPALAHAQAAIRVGAVVSSPQTYQLERDSMRQAPPPPETQRVRVAEGLVMNVQSGAGSVVRATPMPFDSARVVRVTIDYVAN